MNLLQQEPADLVTFTEEVLDGKHHFLCSVDRTEGFVIPKKLPIVFQNKATDECFFLTIFKPMTCLIVLNYLIKNI